MNLLGCLCLLISAGLPGIRQCESAATTGQQGHRGTELLSASAFLNSIRRPCCVTATRGLQCLMSNKDVH